ncbi:MAG: hypothetical protein CMO98_04880 [Woeseia sp.]|nr:hypothetical protein [Woeseia sp.]|tara:strand:- start:804 stop:1943 length:1140 start_codon:yes stop_codon:yes gene_type:complete
MLLSLTKSSHVLLILLSYLSSSIVFADAPILTDEFDRFLVTKETKVGDRIGKIEPVFPNDKIITWELVRPVPGADRRNYLREGQLDATSIVEIDSKNGSLFLRNTPDIFGVEYYAEVRATNEDGSMDQVLIIIAREETPKRENALDIFTQRRSASGLNFYATTEVDPQKIEYAAAVASALLVKDRRRGGPVTAEMEKVQASMTIFKDFEERNTAIEFYMYADAFHGQDLQDEEIIPEYFRTGGPLELRRDASIEEITHLIHDGGIMAVYPDVQQRLENATHAAIDKKLFRPWDGLPEDSFSHEYLTIGLEIFYGGRQRAKTMGSTTNEDGSPRQPAFRLTTDNNQFMTAENLKTYDPELYEIVSFLFPSKKEFWEAMGW